MMSGGQGTYGELQGRSDEWEVQDQGLLGKIWTTVNLTVDSCTEL